VCRAGLRLRGAPCQAPDGGPLIVCPVFPFCFHPTEGGVLSFDKTFNLSSLFVTLSTYANKALLRMSTGDDPIFLGPVFLHGNSDAATYNVFFSCLSGILMDSIVGSSDWVLTMSKLCASPGRTISTKLYN
jgi:hypothetical protein